MTMNRAPELHFRQVVNVLRRRWRSIACASIIGVSLAGAIGYMIPPRYTAKAQIVIDPPANQGVVIDDAAIETRVEVLMSRSHLQSIQESLPDDLIPEHDRNWLTTWVATLAGTFLKGNNEEEESKGPLSIDEIEKNINAYKERRSRVIAVTFTWPNPNVAAAVANHAVQLYIDEAIEKGRAYQEKTIKSLEERVPKAREEVESVEARLQSYRGTYGASEANRINLIDQQIADLYRQLALARSDLVSRQTQLTTLRELQQREDGTPSLIEALHDPFLKQLYPGTLDQANPDREEGPLQAEQAGDAQTSGERQQGARGRIEQSVEKILLRLTGDVDLFDARVRNLQQRLTTLQNASNKAREPEMQLRELQREATASAEAYQNLLRRVQDLREQSAFQPDTRIVSLASAPEHPSSLNPILFTLPALVLSFVFGGMAAVVFEKLDQTIRSEKDVNDTLGLPCIGLIPQLKGLGKLRPYQYLRQHPFAPFTEAIRSLTVSTLKQSWNENKTKAILVTSSAAGEGKTALAISLAAYAALLKQRVLLIDLDLRNPGILAELKGESNGGILEVLQGRAPEEIVKHHDELGIDYLPLPSKSVDPLALLANNKVPDLLAQLREKYDCIIIDSAPLLGVTESRLLISAVDEVVFAIRWGNTKREVAQNALNAVRYLEPLGRDLAYRVSVVITRVDIKKHARYRYGDIGETLGHLSPQSSVSALERAR